MAITCLSLLCVGMKALHCLAWPEPFSLLLFPSLWMTGCFSFLPVANIQSKPILSFQGARVALLGRSLLTYYPKGAMTSAAY